VADKGWQRKFEDPIPLPGGRKLITLRDAADYITSLQGIRPGGMADRDRGPQRVCDVANSPIKLLS